MSHKCVTQKKNKTDNTPPTKHRLKDSVCCAESTHGSWLVVWRDSARCNCILGANDRMNVCACGGGGGVAVNFCPPAFVTAPTCVGRCRCVLTLTEIQCDVFGIVCRTQTHTFCRRRRSMFNRITVGPLSAHLRTLNAERSAKLIQLNSVWVYYVCTYRSIVR